MVRPMKMLALILSLGTLFSTSTLAQSFRLNGSGPNMLDCHFGKQYNPSAKMIEITGSKNPVARCSSNGGEYEIAFVGVSFKTSNEFGKKPDINLRCSNSSKSDGVYLYGGYPPGFDTKNNPKSPFFYNTVEGSSGRCFLEFDRNAITGINAEMNRSAMVLLSVGGSSAAPQIE